jgi:GntR family transcriptional regulator, transcriptional repressor for pyruvate dehydrogenase complex
MPGHPRPPEMAAIRAPASHELVVDQIRRAIQVGRFPIGTRLPSERELARQLGVSRTTVREAIRILEAEALIETRRGRSGGSVVIGPTASSAAIRTAVRRRLGELENVFEYRLAVEPATARLAAERRTKRDLVHLREVIDALSGLAAGAHDSSEVPPPSRFLAADAEFHATIALATRNPLLIAAVEDARAAMFLPVGGVFRVLHPRANDYHPEILAAIEVQDGAGAEQAMTAHIETTRAALLELARPPRLKRESRATSGRRRRRSSDR